mmetsp:Transcript_4307/g.6829  ORF Transcript_4307/g.6829 Transcript_4307/m.6829 type:complete len:194 (+) Transcript_4307:1078-1659(+)
MTLRGLAPLATLIVALILLQTATSERCCAQDCSTKCLKADCEISNTSCPEYECRWYHTSINPSNHKEISNVCPTRDRGICRCIKLSKRNSGLIFILLYYSLPFIVVFLATAAYRAVRNLRDPRPSAQSEETELSWPRYDSGEGSRGGSHSRHRGGKGAIPYILSFHGQVIPAAALVDLNQCPDSVSDSDPALA